MPLGFSTSTRRTRSDTIESCYLPMQPDGSKAQDLHLGSGALAPDFTMTSTVTPVVNNCPNNFICYRINDSQIQCLIVVKMDGFFSERMLLMTRLRGQCNPGKVEPSSTARSLYLANVRLVPSSFLSLDRFVAS